MKIGVTQIILGKMTLDETLDLCQEAGYEAVELVFGEDRDLDGRRSHSIVGEHLEDHSGRIARFHGAKTPV